MIDLFNLEENHEIPKEEPVKEGHNYIGLDRDIYLKKKELEQLTNIYENIKRSEKLRSKINKDFKSGVSKDLILKDCLEVISLMTGDSIFYEQNIKHLKKMTS